MMTLQQILDYAHNRYLCEADYPWAKYPDYAVLRHSSNRKWFAVLMSVSGNKIGLGNQNDVPILNVKVSPEWVEQLRVQTGFLPAYHMNKQHWITVLLEQVDKQTILSLLDESHALTK